MLKNPAWTDTKYANFCPNVILGQAAEPRKALYRNANSRKSNQGYLFVGSISLWKILVTKLIALSNTY